MSSSCLTLSHAVRTVDSLLGQWTHTSWRPPNDSPLASAVAELWLFEGRVAPRRERTFPDGYVSLIVQLGARYRAVSDANVAGDPFPRACIAGVQTAPLVVEAPSDTTRILGMRLRPVGAYALLGAPLPALTPDTIDLADVTRAASDELVERCADAHTADACLTQAAAWVAARLTRPTKPFAAPHPGIAWVASELERARGIASVTRLREQSGLGRTRFAETFRTQVGIGPKRYARVLRFRRALTLLQTSQATPANGRAPAPRGPSSRLSALALAAGYYDHAHLDADFREFAGMTPTAFVAAERYPNSPSLAEWE